MSLATSTGPRLLPPIYDGHVETLTALTTLDGDDAADRFLTGHGPGDLDLARARLAGYAGVGLAVSDRASRPLLAHDTEPDLALRATLKRIADAIRIERHSGGAVTIARGSAEFDRCLADGSFCAVLKIEGADCADAGLAALDVLASAGVRVVGPVWNSPNVFGHNATPVFPGSPDTGPGLTVAGKQLVRWCRDNGVVFDVSHLNEQGFWDAARGSDAPLVASHSNCHALSPHPRNLTDDQLRAVAGSGGLVAVVLAANLLRADGRRDRDTPLDRVVEHVQHAIDVMGIDHVALGSDFDGATIPDSIGDVTGVPRLLLALREHGCGDDDLAKLAAGNWARVFRTVWPAR